jgi:uncharacterized protein (TIGR02246 family)
MRHRTLPGLAVIAAGLIFAYSQLPERPAAAAPKDDDEAIRKATDAYAAAFNKGDVDAALAFWAADAEYIDDAGKSTKGREALTALFTSVFKSGMGAKISIKTSALRYFNDVAWQDGRAAIVQANGAEESSPFTAVWTKKDGKWLLSLVRDQPNVPVVGKDEPNPHLKDLAWLVGEWSHEDGDVKTTLNAKWMKGEKFLIGDLTVFHKGVETMSLIQVLGWDPTGDRLHSWVFDTRGGFGEGYWSRKGGAWTAEIAGVLADGRRGTGTNIWKPVDADTFVFEGLDREIDGRAHPDVKLTYHRVKKTK